MDGATTQNKSTPSSQNDCRISWHSVPFTIGIFEFKTGYAILENYAEGSLVSVGATAIRGLRGRSIRVIITQAKFHVALFVRCSQAHASETSKGRKHRWHVNGAKRLEEIECIIQPMGSERFS